MSFCCNAWFLLRSRCGRTGTVVLVFCALAAGLPRRVSADEVVRQVQEELRKRRMYFGDVDGALNPPTAAALRRYQQRKGFPASGEPDMVTLHSLMIPLPLLVSGAGGATPASPNPVVPSDAPGSAGPSSTPSTDGLQWPEITVLRSDEALRQPPDPSDEDGSLAPTPSQNTVPRPPPAAATKRRITAADAREFIERYLRAGETNDAAAELEFYGGNVDYFDEGNVDRRFIQNDIERYDHRWPERHFTLVEPFSIVNAPDGEDKVVVNFRYRFANKNSRYLVRGKTDNAWTLAGTTLSDLRIVAIKEQRVRE